MINSTDCGIYQILNKKTKDIYIGQSIHLSKRINKHFWGLNKNSHPNKHLQNAYSKYGKNCFDFSVLLYCEPHELDRYEQALVNKLNPSYNINKECISNSRGRHLTPEQKENLSRKHTGKIVSRDARENMSIAQKELWKIPEYKERMSKIRTGRTLSDEQKIKISIALKGKKKSPEHIKKVAESNKGKHGGHLSISHKKSISESLSRFYRGKFVMFLTKSQIGNLLELLDTTDNEWAIEIKDTIKELLK